MMIVGLLTLEIVVYDATSLKDKRRVVVSLKDRIRGRFNVSIAEVGHLDSRQRATLGVALVANDARFVHGCLDKIVEYVRATGPASLLDFQKELL
jgi:uncharacterized protein